MTEVKFTIYGQPVSKGRPRFARAGDTVRTYTPKKTSEYENYVKMAYVNAAMDNGTKVMFHGAVSAKIYGVFPIPKSTSKKAKEQMAQGGVYYTKKIDCDNLAKTILDSLNGIAYEDDKQVAELYVEKTYGEEPRVEVILKEIGTDG